MMIVHLRRSRYPFNDTAGSVAATDYSGNGFHARAGGRVLPSFTGASVVLAAGSAQFLSINSSFGPVLRTMNSFTVTVSFKLKQLSTWSRVFDFGSASG